VSLIESLQLPLQFNPAKLQADLENLQTEEWTDHFNKQDYDGDWKILPLRCPVDAKHPIQKIFSHPAAKEWVDTDYLGQSSYFKEVLGQFDCPLTSVRLMSLAPESRINEHSDGRMSIDGEMVRLHAPVQTSSEVEFVLNGNRIEMGEGELWYLDFSLPHSVVNRSARDRVHLVLDCVVNDWVRGFFDARSIGQ